MLPKNIYYHDRHVSSCKSILKTKQVLNYFSESDFNLSFFLFFFFDLLQYSRNILNNYSTAAYKNAYKAKKKKKTTTQEKSDIYQTRLSEWKQERIILCDETFKKRWGRGLNSMNQERWTVNYRLSSKKLMKRRLGSQKLLHQVSIQRNRRNQNQQKKKQWHKRN